jgi:hypothetical protein
MSPLQGAMAEVGRSIPSQRPLKGAERKGKNLCPAFPGVNAWASEKETAQERKQYAILGSTTGRIRHVFSSPHSVCRCREPSPARYANWQSGEAQTFVSLRVRLPPAPLRVVLLTAACKAVVAKQVRWTTRGPIPSQPTVAGTLRVPSAGPRDDCGSEEELRHTESAYYIGPKQRKSSGRMRSLS